MPRWPVPLQAGALLSVWTPSSPAPAMFPVRFERGLTALEKEGFRLRVERSCLRKDGVAAAPPEEVAEELHRSLRDPDCAGVIASVGGWTMLPVLPYIDWDLIAQARKPIIGYSDLTVLLNVIAHRSGLVAFHGPMVISEWGEAGGVWSHTRAHFLAVTGDETRAEVPVVPSTTWSDEMLWWDRDDDRPRAPSDGQPVRVVRCGATKQVYGRLWGGSLLSLSLLLGTEFWPPPPANAIVFLEAEAMAPDEFATRLHQLRLAGVFAEAGAVVVGKIGRPSATTSGFSDFDAVLTEVLPSGLPVTAGHDIGHTEPMATLPVGGAARLVCPGDGAAPSLTVLRDRTAEGV